MLVEDEAVKGMFDGGVVKEFTVVKERLVLDPLKTEGILP